MEKFSMCSACSSLPRGVLYAHRHNDNCQSFADLLNKACDEFEYCSRILFSDTFANRSNTTDDEARLNIKANILLGSSSDHACW